MAMQSVGVATPHRRHQKVRTELLSLHRALLEQERRDYEVLHGQVGAGTFLHALVHEPELAWLRPYTSLLAELDQDDVPEDWDALRGQLRELLRIHDHDAHAPAQARRYRELFHRSPDVAFGHAATLHALRG